MGTDYQEDLKNLRVEIDALIQRANAFKNDTAMPAGKREIALVHTKLQEAKMWVGKVLEEHGHTLPPEFQDKANV